MAKKGSIDESTAFVLIQTTPSKELYVFDALSKMPEIEYTNPLLGEYDIMAKINRKESHYAIGKIVVDKIRPIDGVEMTTTLQCLKPDAFLKPKEHL